MLKGTRILIGAEANDLSETITNLRQICLEEGFTEVIIPSIWEADTFVKKIGEEKAKLMWRAERRSGDDENKTKKDICLIPEVTGIIQEMWNAAWGKAMPKPTKLFYANRCYRYDRPQHGRYREFTQFGVEILGGNIAVNREIAIALLEKCVDSVLTAKNRKHKLIDNVARGIGYYVENGFEIECELLGAQKQIAGGGCYTEGVGWAIGIERLLLARDAIIADHIA